MKTGIYIVAVLAMALSFVACSNEKDEDITNDVTLDKTVWSYKSSDCSHVEKNYIDSENVHQLESLLEECPAIKRNVTNKNMEETTIENDLCEGHGAHSSIAMTFDGTSCHFVDNGIRQVQMVKKLVETYDCTFTEGEYMGYSNNSYRQYKVYSYGIYKTTVNGDVCVLVLDGSFTYKAKSTTYKSQLTTKTTKNADANLTYKRSGNNIKLSGDGIEISGTIESNPSKMVLYQMKPTVKEFTLTN